MTWKQREIPVEASATKLLFLVSEMMMAYWVNFAANGNPNGTGLPPWPAYQPDGLVQNFGQTVIAHRAPETARFRFLASFRVNGILPAAWRSA